MRAASTKRQKFSSYGVTECRFNEMLKKQDAKCAICNKRFEKTPDIDHDHKTMIVRGLLCNCCNRGIGLLGGGKYLMAAVRYLENANDDNSDAGQSGPG